MIKRKMTVRNVVAIYAMALVPVLSACDMSTGGKPLMGGDIGRGETEDTVVVLEKEPLPDMADIALPAFRPASGEQILRRTAYTVSYNKDTRLPNWVAWNLTADHTDGPFKRAGLKFREDVDVPEPRATDRDYYNSGYDRGHMCPSADCKWCEAAQSESFLFTNACPQVQGLNSGDWNEMEIMCRRWAEKYGSLYIVCGPILYDGKHKRIGKSKVAVPDAFFKVVLRLGDNPSAIGFIYKNMSGNRPKGDYVNTVDEVERITGYDFFPALPDDIETVVEADADIDDWL
ncbi:dNA/RNA non-specific endonuclease [Prevotella sp. MGM1]|nr:dNA/RNA non-specific endonuclease [Prevotella sp. MGM1]